MNISEMHYLIGSSELYKNEKRKWYLNNDISFRNLFYFVTKKFNYIFKNIIRVKWEILVKAI